MDVNDNPPRFANASLEASLSELTPVGHRVLRLHADSADSGANAEIRYRLLDNDGLFSVDAVSGELTLKSPLDYEQRREYHLTIRAFDTSSRPLSATAVVTVRVLDENDNAPQFPPGGFNVTARENADPGTRLPVDIAATDADSGDNGRLAYQIRAGDPDGMFSLDSASGRFYARRRLDRETQELYSLTVTAADHGRPPFTATTTVRVTVLDQNDCSPQFDRPDYSFIAQVDDSGNITQQPYLEDTDPEDPTASLIRVTDCDAPPNGGPFVWSVVEGNSMKFAVSSGRLRISEAFPQPLGVELIRIQACDGGDVIRCGSAQASIRTVRTQSAPPRVLPQNLTAVFAEPPAPGLRLGGVTLAGGRQLEDSNVRLRLASHADRFELGRAGDLLVSNGNLAASRTDYRLRVRAETLNGLRSAQELRLRLVMATEDMTRNAVCLRVSNESGFSFVFSGLESVTREAISQQLRIDSDDAFVLGLQSASDVKGDVPGSSDDLLVVVAAYDRRDRRYLTRAELTARLSADRLASALGGGGRRVGIAAADAAGLCPLEARLATPPTPAAVRLVTARASFLAPRFHLLPPPATDGCWRGGRLSPAAKAQPPMAAVHAQGEARAVWSLDSGLQSLRLQLRTVQTQPGPVLTLRTAGGQREVLQLRLRADGRLSVGSPAAAGAADDSSAELAAARLPVNDGRWHSAEVRLLRPADGSPTAVQLLVDSIDPQFANLPADSALAARGSHEVAIGRGFNGCLRDMRGPTTAPRLRLSGASKGLRPGCSDSLLAAPCAKTPCLHGGACESGSSTGSGAFSCRCPSPYVGARCEVNAEPCASAAAASRCRNGGRCRSGPALGQAVCDCAGTGFQGDTCEADIDECRSVPPPGPCSGRGVCRNLPGGFHCNCTSGFAGPTCAGLPGDSTDGSASVATASFSPLEVATVAGSALLLVVLAFIVFLCVSCLCRRRSGASGSGGSGRRRKSRGGRNGNCNGNGSPASAYGCELHDPSEAVALVTLASGETRLVPQKELGSLGVGMGPLGSAGPSPTYACYERPRPPSSTAATAIGNGRYPSQLVAESAAGTPTRCLTPRGGGGGYPPRFPQVRLPASSGVGEVGGGLGDFLIDEQGGRAAPCGHGWQCSCWIRRGYHWDTSDWNPAANPPDLIPDHSPYCVYSGPNGLQYFSHGRCNGGVAGSSGLSSPANHHHHHQHHQHHQFLRPANSLLLSASASASVAGSLRGIGGGGGGGGGRCCSRCGGAGGVGGSFESLGSALSSSQQQQQLRARGPASPQLLPPLDADGEAEVAAADAGSQVALLPPAPVAASPSASTASPASTTIAAVAAFAASPPALIESPAEDVDDAVAMATAAQPAETAA
ncbi:hypothetical protein BOX15_Mlig000184g4 [Macrostomum lignano]|uniref:Uncharacterized protein n=1 Tax=Macrostomum lignano TaxID=282301 RepID=A0A267DCG5_9PLAT|nr:hypothetical protein BOX15_Mlig000184g4 [Macrostomum lignano]